MWSNNVPTVPGFYWYRESMTLDAQVVELNTFGDFTQTDYEGSMFNGRPAGLFWSERLIQPE